MKKISVFVTVVVLAVLAAGVLRAQTDPFIGTWKLNTDTAKSKYRMTWTFEAKGKGVQVSHDGTAADRSHFGYGFTANYDGKYNPISGTGIPNDADTIALMRINPNTTGATLEKAGKVVMTARLLVSNNGKVLTITVKDTEASGQPVRVLVYDKQ